MHHCEWKVVILSQDLHLEALLKREELSALFKYEIKTFSTAMQQDCCGADIIIMDYPFADNPMDIRADAGKDATLIACASPDQIRRMENSALAALDDIWEKPLEDRVAGLRFRRCLEQLQSGRQAEINLMFLDTLLECMPDMVWFKNIEGNHVKVNSAFCQTVGKTMEDVTGKDHCYIWDISREEFEKGEFVCKETDEFVLRHRQKCFSTEKVRSQHGMRQFNTYKAPLIDDNGKVMGTVGIGHDITALENMSAELELILRTMPFAILVWNEDGTIINTNEKFEEYFRISRNEIIGKSFKEWSKNILNDITKINSNGYAEAQIRYEDSDKARILEIYELPIQDVFHNEAGRLCIYRDITKERALENQILKSSNTDFLTELNNRRSFYQYIRENRGRKRLSLFSVDLDLFKKVNDTYGHKAGDEALVATARILQECFPNDFIARIGGDEFLVAKLGDYTEAVLEQQAARLLVRMQQVFSASRYTNFLSASIGIACTDDPSMDIDELLRQSDAALYEAKLKGKAQYCFYSQIVKRQTCF